MTLAKAAPSSKPSAGGCCRSKRQGRRRRMRTFSGHKRTNRIATQSCRRGRRKHRESYFDVMLSIAVLLLACSTIREVPLMATALLQKHNCRASHSISLQTNNNSHIRQLPSLPRRTLIPLHARQDKADDNADDDEPSGFGAFFRRDDKADDPNGRSTNEGDNEDEGSLKDVPIVGRFFATDEEKEEKKRLKKEEKEEKFRIKQEEKEIKVKLKMEAKERKRREKESDNNANINDDADEKDRDVVSGVRNYFRERQIREDAEILRLGVRRKEELRKQQLERDAEELRQAVQKREAERRERMAKLKTERAAKASLKVPSASVAADITKPPSEDIVRRKIQAQKVLDQKRKERIEKIRADRESIVSRDDRDKQQQQTANDKDDEASKKSGSKSQRFGNVVSAAQKFVSDVFNSEEWIVIAPKTRISPGEIVPLTAAGIDLLLVASKDGSAIHCVANSCPHLGTPLEVGSLERLPIESGPPNAAASSSSSINPVSKNPEIQPVKKESSFFQENDIASMLKQDGCEDCIVCPLHKTAFALKSGEVRGEWCPYPPVIGKLTGAIKTEANLPVFDVRTRGKNIEVRLNTPVKINDDSKKQKKKKR